MHDPVIILAPPRSFTSVICTALGEHPSLYGVPELHLFMAETMRERDGMMAQLRFLEHGLLRVVSQLFGDEQTLQTVSLARRWLEIRLNCTCASVLRELVEKVNSRILVDKSITTVLQSENLQRVESAFPNTRFIHLTRHPRSMGESLWKMGGRVAADYMDALDYSTDPPVTDFQRLWYRTHMNIITFLNGQPDWKWRRVRGEDLLADPDRHFPELAKWLDLPADEQSIEVMKHPERSPYACLGPANAALGNDPGFLREPALRPYVPPEELTLDGPLDWREDGVEFSPEVKALAAEFGYR